MSNVDFIKDVNLYTKYNTNRLLDCVDFAVKGIPYIFFTTPMMNMTTNNCGQDSFLTYMQSTHPDLLSMLSYGSSSNNKHATTSPFIKLLSNLSRSFEPKDASSKTKEVGENFVGVKLTLPSSNVDSYVGDEFSIRFNDMRELPMLKLLNAWFVYHNNVRKGVISPTEDAIENHYIDYLSSVFFFVTEMDGETIQYWSKYTGVAPINVPFSNFSSEWSNHDLIEYSASFVYSFKEDMNPDTLVDFNKVSTGQGMEVNFDEITREIGRAHV